jgi:hypothetical protein
MHLLRMIKTHNYLNGNIFSLMEFLVMSVIIAPFAVYYIFHGPWFYATTAVGIVLNCLTVSFVALQSLLKKEESIGLVKVYFDKDVGKRMRTEYPKMSQETFILCIAVLIPFLLFITSAYDAWTRR